MDRLPKSGRLIVSVLLVTLLAACRAQQTPEPLPPEAQSSPTASVSILPTPTPTRGESPLAAPTSTPGESPLETPAARTSERRVEGGTLGSIWNLAALRYAEHPDCFRLTLEMAEARATAPFHTVTLTDEETQPFPGTRDPAWGSVRIDLVVSDLYAYDYPLGDQLPIRVEGNPVVTAVSRLPLYDDALLGFSIWLESRADFEVHELTGPVRIAVDVLYP
ncbi:MAG: hypothetical protein U9R72_04160 [Chloroflexota bacterium]|nr:hypothetical protein [Chloroflexota bacterium]